MNDSTTPIKKKIPDYYNPHNTIQEPSGAASFLAHEPEVPDPAEILKRKYPIRVIAEVLILVVCVMAIPVALYLNQKPTEVFIEATATPTPTETPTPTPTSSPITNKFMKIFSL